MKKVLFATTALVASAGIASAQGVELSGSAEMGIVGGSAYGETQFHHDIDVTFTLSGETDNGISFGATIDLDEVDQAGNGIPAGANPSSVYISGSFGTLTMGDTDGALDWALQEVNLVGGSIDDSETAHAGFNGNAALDGSYDGQVARYDYSFGDFAFAVSAELDDTGVGDPALGIGGKYSGDLGGVTLGVGVGYQSNGIQDALGVSLDAAFGGGFVVGINYTDLAGGWSVNSSGRGGFAVDPVDSHMAIGLGYTMDALSIGVNYGVYSSTIPGWIDPTGYGLAVNYDLGGGATVQFGYGSSTVEATFGPVGTSVSTDSFSLGLAMSF